MSHAERTILGAAMLDSMALQDAIAAIQPPDFLLDANKRVYAAILRLQQAHEGVDVLTVCNALAKAKELDAVGGRAYVAELTEGIPRNLNIGTHIRALQSESGTRTALTALANAQARLGEGDEHTLVVDDLIRHLTATRPDSSRWAADVVPKLIQAMNEQADCVIPSGVTELDTLLKGGFRTKQLVVIGAFPSSGKSALCRQIERAALRHGFGVHAISAEEPEERWMMHHLIRTAGMPAFKVQEPISWNREDRDVAHEVIDAMLDKEQWRYKIDDVAGMRLDDVLARWRISAVRDGIKLFTLDYLQLMVGKSREELHEITEMVTRMKRFAKEHDAVVVALSQVTEDRGSKSEERPQVNMLRGAGTIRQAADIIILPHHPKDEHNRSTGLDELDIAKNRNGMTARLQVHFNTKTLEFEPDYRER